MSNNKPSPQVLAPCIIDDGLVVNKEDMYRLLNDLGHVRYFHYLDNQCSGEGEGYIVEVFDAPSQSTLIANQTIYLNLSSFDYLQLQTQSHQTYFDLVQEQRTLRLVPLSNPLNYNELNSNLDAATLEAMVTDVLSARHDVRLDDEDDEYFF
ncbi:hypothetical protein PCC7418_2233 [Halothece sp. PCC 7418]|uniref:hypothetical protein n=1 Tax=Halothece sp. (strain PCC 7418) TaxID=65093 RepID=UPI0002A07CE2|nr:hypothetical protein [Halothece sp. PCC 7418]AFZ44387.1 hypothetical protein PCC7418_2233 [Halothece sp. PCC 7418]